MSTDPATKRPLVIVTGGSGLLGSRLIDDLRQDHHVVSFDLDGDPRSAPDVEFVCTDLTSDESVGRALARVRELFGGEISSVVHLAAYYDFAGGDSPLYEQVTVEGTRRLLRHLDGFDVEQFVFSSTMLVHQPTEFGDEVDESSPIEGSWPYPASKVATEAVIDENSSVATSNVIVRIAGAYDEMGHSPPITNQVKRIEGRWVTSHFYPADLRLGQAFVHIDDAVDALARIVRRRRQLPAELEVLIGEPDTVGYGELQDLIAHELHGVDSWPTFEVPPILAKLGAWVREKNPLGPDPFIKSWMVDRATDHYDLDISTARQTLDWEPEHHVADVIPEMIDRLKADRETWYRENDLEPPRRVARLAS
jgi:nucleoside-diphosphate-sugar epimerase